MITSIKSPGQTDHNLGREHANTALLVIVYLRTQAKETCLSSNTNLCFYRCITIVRISVPELLRTTNKISFICTMACMEFT